jgi:hypothetical protein
MCCSMICCVRRAREVYSGSHATMSVHAVQFRKLPKSPEDVSSGQAEIADRLHGWQGRAYLICFSTFCAFSRCSRNYLSALIVWSWPIVYSTIQSDVAGRLFRYISISHRTGCHERLSEPKYKNMSYREQS